MVQDTPAPHVPDGERTGDDSERTAERKREILRAASEVFRRKGLHAAGMREIAAEAGMHAGNLYYYFANKQEILAFCQQDSLAQLDAMARRVLDEESVAERRLARLVAEHVRILNEAIPGSLAHLEVEALEEPWRQRIQRQRDAYEAVFRDVVRQGIESGAFRAGDPKLTALALLGAVNWTVKWFQSEGELSADAIGREFARLLVDGLRSRATQ